MLYIAPVFFFLSILIDFLHLFVESANILTNSSVCIKSSSSFTYGSVDCSSGEVNLLGKYLKIGIHNAGSFGTSSSYTSDYYTGQLSSIADPDKNGFNEASKPSFSGDYFSPGAPIEGKFWF